MSITIGDAPKSALEWKMKKQARMMSGAIVASLLLPCGAMAAGLALPAAASGQTASLSLPSASAMPAATGSSLAGLPVVPAATSTLAANDVGHASSGATLPGLEGVGATQVSAAPASGGGGGRAIRPIRVPGTNIIIPLPGN
jgi:hypothetical protein